MTLEQLVKFPIFDCMRAILKKLCATFAICATFGPIWVRNGPDVFCRGRIELIKSQGSTSQKVT